MSGGMYIFVSCKMRSGGSGRCLFPKDCAGLAALKNGDTYIQMKRLAVFALAALLTASASLAGTITVDEAKAVASQFLNTASAVRKASGGVQQLTLAGSSTGYYAFNRGASAGYVIVAADDRAAAQVLGYADEGTLDMAALPENMAWWLAEYDRQTACMAQSAETASRAAAVKYADIAPLVTAQWNQSSPYNDLCPDKSGKKCPSGCVATAMAQIMYYHKWPLNGTGSNAYTWNGETLSADFSASTYAWDSMTDTYGSQSSDASKAAVAQLMYDAGISVNMAYDNNGSGAASNLIPTAMAGYFSYDKNIKYLQRSYYSVAEWNEIVYRELAASRPVYYSGVTDDNSVGHAFVCDGYRDGYFHINWGWGGLSNGYFLLSALDPGQQGVGGSTSGYNSSQDIVINIRKARENTTVEPLYYNNSDFSASQTTFSFSETASFKGRIFNGGVYESKVNLGIMAVGASADTTYIAGGSGTYRPNSGTGILKVGMSQFPKAEGEYTVWPAYQDPGTGVWYKMHTKSGCKGSLAATVSGDNVTFSTIYDQESELTSTDFAATSQLYAGKGFTATALVGSEGADYTGKVYVLFTSVGGTDWVSTTGGKKITIGEGTEQTVTVTGTAPSDAGSYDIQLLDKSFNAISGRVTVTVREVPSGTLALTLANQLRIAKPKAVVADNISISATIRCTSGFFNNSVAIGFFKSGGNTSSDMIAKNVIAGEGDEVTVVFEGTLTSAEVGDTYVAALYYMDNNEWKIMPAIGSGYNYLTFTVGHLTGIDDATTTSATAETLVYTLSGTLVARFNTASPDLKSLPKGLYVVKRGAETRKVRN